MARAYCAGSYPHRPNAGPIAPPVPPVTDLLLLSTVGADNLLLSTVGSDQLALSA
jgi:hypothetical protein